MPVCLCSGRLLRRVVCAPNGFAGRALLVMTLVASPVGAQTATKPAAKKTAEHRANELTLGGLRPGRDSLARAAQVNKQFGEAKELQGEQTAWFDTCRDISLTIDSDKEKRIQVIRVGAWSGPRADCANVPPSPWKTGLGLKVGDPAPKALQMYGQPDSRSPSTRNGQPLELWYYAFDWAGPDVPQVMEVVCTKEAEGKPARVVEITLAAPSL